MERAWSGLRSLGPGVESGLWHGAWGSQLTSPGSEALTAAGRNCTYLAEAALRARDADAKGFRPRGPGRVSHRPRAPLLWGRSTTLGRISSQQTTAENKCILKPQDGSSSLWMSPSHLSWYQRGPGKKKKMRSLGNHREFSLSLTEINLHVWKV